MPFNKHVSSWLYIHQWHYYSQKSFHFAQLRHSIPTKQQFPIYCFPTRWQRVCVCVPLCMLLGIRPLALSTCLYTEPQHSAFSPQY